ncbi:MAG: hypothetical protein B7X02_00430 [Rhodospirillales bacterium 12-54-5]|nr:MAG: hypothetical protein B7X02_00430 [Rhodospirillales bacterium 12-54-5]
MKGVLQKLDHAIFFTVWDMRVVWALCALMVGLTWFVIPVWKVSFVAIAAVGLLTLYAASKAVKSVDALTVHERWKIMWAEDCSRNQMRAIISALKSKVSKEDICLMLQRYADNEAIITEANAEIAKYDPVKRALKCRFNWVLRAVFFCFLLLCWRMPTHF